MCLLVGLAVAVFCWGLQYKLSLYKAPDRVNALSLTAKLSDRESEGMAVAPLKAPITRAIVSADFALAVAVLALAMADGRGAKWWNVATELGSSFQPYRGLPAFSFRPPPSIS